MAKQWSVMEITSVLPAPIPEYELYSGKRLKPLAEMSRISIVYCSERFVNTSAVSSDVWKPEFVLSNLM